MKLESRLFATGYCTHPGSATFKGDPWKPRLYAATCAVISHPSEGLIAFDTGYAPRFHEAARGWPYRLYSLVTPVTTSAAMTLSAQLASSGRDPAKVRTVILSHFHADHMAGLRDFPQAAVVCSREAFNHFRSLTGLAAVRRGYLPSLAPHDLASRARFIEDAPEVPLCGSMAPFRIGFDVLGDGSVLAVRLPGHARGQFGILFADAEAGMTFMVADACWSSRAYRENIGPSLLAGLIQDDMQASGRTLGKLHDLHRSNPRLRIVPCHCQEVWREIGGSADA